MKLPRVTVGVVSYNRLRYLRALMESARICVEYPDVEWIVVDGNSVERGLREYLESLDFVDVKLFEDCTHAQAMNRIVERATGDFLMLLPEDVQFIVAGPWLQELVSVAARWQQLGHITFNAQRNQTIERQFSRRRYELRLRGRRLRIPRIRRPFRTYCGPGGMRFLGYGPTREGICASGITSFCRTEIWRALGPWRTTSDSPIGDDSSLGAEDDMLRRFANSGIRLESAMMRVPVAADLVTDPRGTKARVRGGVRRYGHYPEPIGGPFYYRIRSLVEARERAGGRWPAPGFEEVVEPIGFELPVDPDGNLLKTSVIDEDEPYQLVDAPAAD